MENPKLITPNRIITERHKAWDITKTGNWHRVRELHYKGIIYWEIINKMEVMKC